MFLRIDWVKWEKPDGKNNRSLRKKYLDLIAAAPKVAVAKDPSISSLVAPVKKSLWRFVKSYVVLKVNTNKSGCGF